MRFQITMENLLKIGARVEFILNQDGYQAVKNAGPYFIP